MSWVLAEQPSASRSLSSTGPFSVEVGCVRDWQVVPLRPLRSATAVFVVDTVRLEGGPLQNKMLGHWITSFLGFVELCLSLLL